MKIGDKVKVIKIDTIFCGQIGTIIEKGNIYDWKVDFGYDYNYFYEEDLELVSKTLDNLEVGDILVDKDRDEKKVLGICGEVYFLSYENNFDSFGDMYTLKEIKKLGFKLKSGKSSDKTIEVSMDEIAEKFSIPVEKLKIKKEK